MWQGVLKDYLETLQTYYTKLYDTDDEALHAAVRLLDRKLPKTKYPDTRSRYSITLQQTYKLPRLN